MNSKNNKKYLISIAIGPVQDFIASARRSRDLWFGSWLLSELSKAAAKSIVEQNGELIFPNTDKSNLKPNTSFNVVNKILAEIKANPKTISEVGENVKKAIDERLEVIRNEAFKKVSKQYFLENIAKKQIADLVEFFWTAVVRTNSYENDRNNVEKLFSARKATRNFNSVTWGDNVPKSSLDGQRESVLMEELYKEVQDGRISKQKLRVDYGVKEGERLCGVGLLKRHGKVENRNENSDENYQDRFFSTSHVASLPLLQRLTDKDTVNDYISILSVLLTEIEPKQLYKILGRVPENLRHNIFGVYDGHLLFEERLSEFFSDKIDLQKAKDALIGVPEKNNKPPIKGFLEKAFGKNAKPLPYYALVLADGDFMGKAIDSIQKIAEIDGSDPKEKHKELSGKLSDFAKEVGKIIEKDGQGSLIYAGGDDVLAFVGLHKVLKYANELQDKFYESLKDFKYDGKKSPTLSVGIAVVHHLEPLEDALELVRKAEKAAKSVDGKNALAVVVDKRSGASRIAKGTWGTLDERLQTFIRWHQASEIPDGAAYELRDLAIRLDTTEFVKKLKDSSVSDEEKEQLKNLIENLNNAKQAEAIRILKRKKGDFGGKDIEKEVVEKIGKYLENIKPVEKEGEEKKNDDSIAILADELIIAKIFADAKDLAEGK
jgi:CRISPR-associated protein Cmr2